MIAPLPNCFSIWGKGRGQRILFCVRLGLLGGGDHRILIFCHRALLLYRKVSVQAKKPLFYSLSVYHKSKILQQEVV